MSKSRNSKWYDRKDFDDNDYYEDERRHSRKSKRDERRFNRALKTLDTNSLKGDDYYDSLLDQDDFDDYGERR